MQLRSDPPPPTNPFFLSRPSLPQLPTELHKALVAAEDDLAFEEITSWRTLARYHAHKQAQQPKRSEGGGRGFFGLFSGGGDEKSGRKSLSDADLANIAHELGLHEQAMHKTGPTDFHPAW
eukprot:5878529-Pleurochrysis_carterae.AAC.2